MCLSFLSRQTLARTVDGSSDRLFATQCVGSELPAAGSTWGGNRQVKEYSLCFQTNNVFKNNHLSLSIYIFVDLLPLSIPENSFAEITLLDEY